MTAPLWNYKSLESKGIPPLWQKRSGAFPLTRNFFCPFEKNLKKCAFGDTQIDKKVIYLCMFSTKRVMDLKEILKKEGLKGKELSEMLGLNYDWYRRATMPSRRSKLIWVLAFELGYKLGSDSKKEE